MEQVTASQTTARPEPTHPLIESDSVEGITVYVVHGTTVGEIQRLVIEKVSGKVVYAVIVFGGYYVSVKSCTLFVGVSSPTIRI